MSQLLILHEKHEQIYFICEDTDAVYKVALSVFAARLRAGWYKDDDLMDKGVAEARIKEGDGYRAWNYLRLRSDLCCEYEGLTLTGFQEPDTYEAWQWRNTL
jgi:putative component of toxin-antitoxin plasmid stabilization module